MRKHVVFTLIFAVLAGAALYLTPGCNGSKVETTSPTSPATAPGVVTSSDTTAATPATATGTASAKVWAHGKVDVTGPWNGFICYFWKGPHEQDKAHPDVAVSIPDGSTVSYDWPGIKPDNDPLHCDVQLDVGTSCAKSSIIPGMLGHAYIPIKECDECIEAPVETVVCTECPTGEVKPEDCHQTCTKTIDYQCKDDVVTTFTEPCVCTTSCVEEGPYVGDPVWFPEILKGPCPETFNTSCREKCHQLGEQTTTWDCTDPTTDPLCRPADCPPDPGVCYYTPDCRVGPTGACPEYMKRYMCNEQGGEWANWNGQNNQCKTSLPGIYLSNFRLVPGQSHKDCLKYTGPN